MKNVDSLAQHSDLVSQLKIKTSCKLLKTNCFLTAGELSDYIAQGNWKYVETSQNLYFFHTDDLAVHLYYYASSETIPDFGNEFSMPVMADFVLRERELADFESVTVPLWEKEGFAFYKKYQRMRCNLAGDILSDADVMPDGYIIKEAELEQAEEIRRLWVAFLDKYDIVLPSIDETMEQIRKGNVVCCMAGEKICGAVFVDVNGRSGLVQHVTVHEDYRRKALGERMMRYLYEIMPQRNITDFKLWVDVNNVAAINLYMKCGLKKDGVYSVKLMKG